MSDFVERAFALMRDYDIVEGLAGVVNGHNTDDVAALGERDQEI